MSRSWSPSTSLSFVTRAGEKLAFALDHFSVDVRGLTCADLGSHVGGFVDCLLQRGAAKIYSIDTAYGILAWKLRKDPRVIVMERTNAMHVLLPEAIDLVTIDAGWTRQTHILPNAQKMLKSNGHVLTLIKPHYEADTSELVHGILGDADVGIVARKVCASIELEGWIVHGVVDSPIRGHGGNREVFAMLSPAKPREGKSGP